MRPSRPLGTGLGALVIGCTIAACAGVPWGQGGAEPASATTSAFVKTIDRPMLQRASARLEPRVMARWANGAMLGQVSSTPGIDWHAWSLAPGPPRLELRAPAPLLPTGAMSNVDFAVVVHVPLAASEHDIELSGAALDSPCTVKVAVAAGELDVPMDFSADKLGRVQGVILPGASYRALSDVTPNAILRADFSACQGQIDPGAQLAALRAAFAEAAVGAVGEALSAEVPVALGLDLAFAWSAAVNGDGIGTGFLRTALRALSTSLVRRQADGLQLDFALSIQADAHPCMAGLALPAPRTGMTPLALPAGNALHIASLERLIAASWLAGSACANHLGVIPVPAEPLVAAWPALAQLGPGAVVSIELWPSALPRLIPDPRMLDGLVLESGRMRADLIVSFAGARWRAASVVLDLSIAGALWVDEGGLVFFDPAAVEAVPSLIEAVLLSAPEAEAIAVLLPPLVEALVLERPLARLPPSLAPMSAAGVTVSGEYLSWPSR